MMRLLRRALLVLLGVVLLGAGLLAGLQVALGRGAFTAEVDAALEHALGRNVTHGALRIGFGLEPQVVLTEATIANLPGSAHPDLARIGRLEVTLALWPLLRGHVAIDSLRLEDAEIVLERDAAGRPNWAFGEGGGGGGIAISSLEIARTRVLLPGGPVARIDIEELSLERDAPGETLEIEGRLALDGERLAITAELGSETPEGMPVEASITGEGLQLRAKGRIPHAVAASGWSLDLTAQADAAAARRLAERFGIASPVTGPLQISGRASTGAPWPNVSNLVVTLGPAEAHALLPGLSIARAELRAASFDEPVALSAMGRRGGADLGLVLTAPPLRRIAEAAAEDPLAIEAVVTSGQARLTLSGEVRRSAGLGAADLAARLTTPDFAIIGPALGASLPRLREVTAEARLSGVGTPELRLRALRWASQGIQAEGELRIGLTPRLGFQGQVTARRLDLDALGGGGAPARRGARVIPDLPLPLALLRGADATLDLTVAALVSGGVTWRDLRTRLVLRDGRLVADPLSFGVPGGNLSGRLAIDASGRVAQTSLALRSQGRGLDLVALRRGLGVSTGFEGSAELAVDLRGRGETTRALAASLSGEAGISMVGGRFLGGSSLRIGPDLARILLPRGAPSGGIALRCLALRFSAEDGLAQSQAFLLEGEFGRIDGSMAVNLRDEALAARLLPDIRVMGVTVRAPVTIGGTLAAPRLGVEPGAALARVVGDTVANRLWRSSTVEFLRGVTGDLPAGGECAPALTLARLGRAGPMPEAAAAPIPLVPRELQGTAQEVVRGIGGLLGGRRR